MKEINENKSINKIKFIILKSKLKRKDNPEGCFQRFLERKGYDVYKCIDLPVRNLPKDKIKRLFKTEEEYHIIKRKFIKKLDKYLINERRTDRLISLIKKEGCPDFLVFNDEKLFFIELKSNGDGLRLSQLEWVIKSEKEHKIQCYVAYFT